MDTENTDYCPNFEQIKAVNRQSADCDCMGKDDRRDLVLGFMAEHSLALPPTAWYRNLRIHRTVTFGKDSLRNYLDEFVEEGLAARVDKEALDNGEVRPISEDEYRAYYIITDKGQERVND